MSDVAYGLHLIFLFHIIYKKQVKRNFNRFESIRLNLSIGKFSFHVYV